MLTYRLTQNAKRDLIHTYIEGVKEFGVDQAEIYQNRLEHTFSLIADNPSIARKRTEIIPPVHAHPCGSHIIIYIIDEEGVLIVGIRHYKENWIEQPFA